MARNRRANRKNPRDTRDAAGRFRKGNPIGKLGGRPRIDAEQVGRAVGHLRRRGRDSRAVLDAWSNYLTKLGTSGDKRTANRFCFEQVDGQLARDLWRGNDIAARVIELLPREAVRRGWDMKIEGADREEIQPVETKAQELKLNSAFADALMKERAYGGSAILPMLNDGNADLTQPLDEARIHTLTGFRVLEARELRPVRRYNSWEDGKLGEVEIWEIQPRRRVSAPMIRIHSSRLIYFPGIRVAHDVDGAEVGHGESVLSRFYNALSDYESAIGTASHLLQDFSQGIMKIAKLDEMADSADSEQELIEHFALIDLLRSVVNSVVIGGEDSFSRQSTDLSGVPDTIDRLERRVASAADLPLTVVFGMSPGGLNSTGENERAFVNDRTAALQTDRLPQLERGLQLIMLAQDGPTQGVEPEAWSAEFRPLEAPDDSDIVDMKHTQAETDQIYIEMGVVTAEQVMRARFGGERWSHELHIDLDEYDRAVASEADQARVAGASATDVQATALNGAQISAMLEIAKSVGAGEIDRDGAAAMLALALQIDETQATSLLGSSTFQALVPAPPVPPGPPIDTTALRADAAGHGTMIALYPPPEVVAAMSQTGGADADAMHVTIAYLGKIDEPQVETAVKVARRWAAAIPAIDGTVNGVARFSASSTSDGMDVIVALLDSPALTRERPRLIDMLARAGIPAREDHGYCAHMTLRYVAPDAYDRLERVEPAAGTFELAVSAGLSRVPLPFGTAHADEIKSRGGKWYVYDRTGTKELAGPFDSEEQAVERLRQIEGHAHDRARRVRQQRGY